MADGAVTSSPLTGDAYVKLAREMVPQVKAVADEINRTRELPEQLANTLADQGLFRLLVPPLPGRG